MKGRDRTKRHVPKTAHLGPGPARPGSRQSPPSPVPTRVRPAQPLCPMPCSRTRTAQPEWWAGLRPSRVCRSRAAVCTTLVQTGPGPVTGDAVLETPSSTRPYRSAWRVPFPYSASLACSALEGAALRRRTARARHSAVHGHNRAPQSESCSGRLTAPHAGSRGKGPPCPSSASAPTVRRPGSMSHVQPIRSVPVPQRCGVTARAGLGPSRCPTARSCVACVATRLLNLYHYHHDGPAS